ncbi:hypothetical protein K443DRAFT_99573 [Laccaria amethystina LaAM-08-1]|uniref:Uncharacterized protein n=1 Tax=Laccaria amethystina LaAM-08-1 TaxID=1095629 RepID=A0A0C9XT56_9AGAR|nr:hypothetical protein K443DRAFT_99573 [Laccaria amethystina LaAM-08-1]
MCSYPVPTFQDRIFTRPYDRNLMIDTFIANATVDDLRSIVRNLLAAGPPGVAPAFANAARSRLRHTYAKALPNSHPLFRRQPHNIKFAVPTELLQDTLANVRSLYGGGMGFCSLAILTSIVRATLGLRWEEEGDMADILAVIDVDIGQAIQSSKEEIEGGHVHDFASARKMVHDLRSAIDDSLADVQTWAGEFPFDRASASLHYWKL